MNNDQLEFDYNVNMSAQVAVGSTSSIGSNGVVSTAAFPNTSIVSGGGGAGMILSAGGPGAHWSTPITHQPGTYNTDFIVQGKVKAKDVEMDGVSLKCTLEKIEERLAILKPNEALESRWEELKELGDRYRQLEKELLDKEYVWNRLAE